MLYLQLFWVYFKIGLFGFGGGYAMLSLIQDEVVRHYGWITTQEFTDIVAISQLTPGPIGINSATYVGYMATGSVWGAALATFSVCLPSFLLVLAISLALKKFSQNQYVQGALIGIRPASVGLIASAAMMLMFHPSFISNLGAGKWPQQYSDVVVTDTFADPVSLVIFIAVFVLTITKKFHPIWSIVAAAIIGMVVY